MRSRYRWRVLSDLEHWLEKPMLVLSVVWLSLVVVDLSGAGNGLVTGLGTAIWIIFVVEFALRLTLAPEKWPFLRHNWITVIALLVPPFACFALRSSSGPRHSFAAPGWCASSGPVNRTMNALSRTLSRRGFGYALLLTLVVLLTGAAGMLSFEPASQVPGGFTSYWHALWWTGMLIASLGTDFWPRTLEGRLLSSLLALYGLAVFSYITASFASFFIDRDASISGSGVAGSGEIRCLRRELAALRQELQSGRVLEERRREGSKAAMLGAS